MKTLRLNKMVMMLALFLLVATAIRVQGQVLEAEVPGDNFSLEGALELFKKANSPENFEQLLNDPDSKVNNLDLNGDGYIDYIRVFDRNEGNIHAFILQAVISDTESQDIAVIELEKLANGKAILQITGDADIYGIETIIEPTEEVRVNAGTTTTRRVVNVWGWPSVQYIYGPYYSVWVSPWGWSLRPVWWHTWRPVVYYEYYPYWYSYRPYYSVCYSHRIAYASIYRPYRTTSVIVHNRHHQQVEHYRSRRSDRDGYVRGRDGGSNGGRNGRVNGVDNNMSRWSSAEKQRESRNPIGTIKRQETKEINGRSSMDSFSSTTKPSTEIRGSKSSPQRSPAQWKSDNSSRTRTQVERPQIQRTEVQRPQVQRSEVQRSQPQRTEVQRSQPQRVPQVQRSQPQRTPQVQRSQPQRQQVQRPQVTRPSAPTRSVTPSRSNSKPSAPAKSSGSDNKVKRGKN